MHDEAIRTLNEMIRLDLDALHAYRQAEGAAADAGIKELFADHARDHERHVDHLSATVRALGGEPAGGRALDGFFVEGFTAISDGDDRSAVLTMRANEELCTSRYGAARRIDVGAPEAADAIERAFEDEAQHLARLKDLIAEHGWEELPGRGQAA